MAVFSVIEKKLDQKPLESKKAIYALYGAVCVLLVFIGSAFLILRHAEAAHEIVELASLTIMFFGATITTLITGQAAMDWKAVSALQHISEDKDEKINIHSNQPLAPEINVLRRDPKDYLLTHDTSF
jgi:hypothetical protein